MAIGLSTGLIDDNSVITPAFTLTYGCYSFRGRGATLSRSVASGVRGGRRCSIAAAGLRGR